MDILLLFPPSPLYGRCLDHLTIHGGHRRGDRGTYGHALYTPLAELCALAQACICVEGEGPFLCYKDIRHSPSHVPKELLVPKEVPCSNVHKGVLWSNW